MILSFPEGQEVEKIDIQDDIKPSDIITFKLEDGENWGDIVKNFYNLKIQLLKKYLKGTIQIAGRTIIVNQGENQQFYVIEDGIKKAILLESININLMPEKGNNQIKKSSIGTRNNMQDNDQASGRASNNRQKWIEQNNLLIENIPNLINIIDEDNNTYSSTYTTDKEKNERS